MTTTPTAMSVFEALIEDAFGRRDLVAVEQLGHPGLAAALGRVLEAFPDATIGVDAVVADERRASAWFTMAGTHEGPWRDIPASGRSVQVMGALTIVVDGGAVRDFRVVVDSLSLYEQVTGQVMAGLKACQLPLSAAPGAGRGRSAPPAG